MWYCIPTPGSSTQPTEPKTAAQKIFYSCICILSTVTPASRICIPSAVAFAYRARSQLHPEGPASASRAQLHPHPGRSCICIPCTAASASRAQLHLHPGCSCNCAQGACICIPCAVASASRAKLHLRPVSSCICIPSAVAFASRAQLQLHPEGLAPGSRAQLHLHPEYSCICIPCTVASASRAQLHLHALRGCSCIPRDLHLHPERYGIPGPRAPRGLQRCSGPQEARKSFAVQQRELQVFKHWSKSGRRSKRFLNITRCLANGLNTFPKFGRRFAPKTSY